MKLDDVPNQLKATIEMLEELERFTGADLSHAIGICARVQGAYLGNPLDTEAVLALQRSQGHKPSKGASNVRKFRELRLVPSGNEFTPASFPTDTSDAGTWEIRPPGPI